MKSIRTALCVFLTCLTFMGTLSVAAEPYQTYLYSYWGKPVASPAGFTVETTYTGRELGVGKLFEPKDLYISSQKEIFIADGGNNRVLVFDQNWKLLQTVTAMTDADGKKTALKMPSGVFVDKEGARYIADTGNKRVIKCDKDGHLLQTYGQPENDIQFTGIDYLPQRIVVDDTGYVYVLCKGIYQGALVYENKGKFIGYYGTNYVEAGLSSALELLWKRLATDEQRSKMARFVPEEFTSFTIDDKGFLYTATEITKTSKNQIKRINPLGVDVLEESNRVQQSYQGRYGDLELRWHGGKVLQTRFVDISYDPKGFINALDRERGRIFQYDTEGNLLMLGGGSANQAGTFKKVIAIDNLDDRLYVLDEQKANITVFCFTEYGQEMRKAITLYNAGKFSESKDLWTGVLQKNGNCELAYAGIGKVLYEEGRYAEAMKYFKLGYDRPGYAKAFSEYRLLVLRRVIPWIATVVIVLLVVVFIRSRFKKLKALLHAYREE